MWWPQSSKQIMFDASLISLIDAHRDPVNRTGNKQDIRTCGYALSDEYSLIPIHKLYRFRNRCEYKVCFAHSSSIATIALKPYMQALTLLHV
jgi:hypothetical protein